MVGIFPGCAVLIRLVGAVLAEQHDEWIGSRRYLDLDLIQQSQAVGTTPALDNDKEELHPDRRCV